MKARITTRMTTMLTIAGVLVAGSAAALVNTQVLQSSGDGSTNNVDAISTVDSTLPDGSTVSSSSSVPTDSTLSPVTADSATQAMYQVGDAGFVTLDTAGDVLRVVAATPGAGWSVVETENDGPLNVEVKFQSSTVLVEFKANLLFGVVSTSVETKGLDGSQISSPDTNSSTPGSGSVDDHGGDDGGGDDNSGPGGGGDDHGSGDD